MSRRGGLSGSHHDGVALRDTPYGDLGQVRGSTGGFAGVGRF
ncbi:hypothetical protein AB0E10_07380 [Streptomyces sp. NPDC048045]